MERKEADKLINERFRTYVTIQDAQGTNCTHALPAKGSCVVYIGNDDGVYMVATLKDGVFFSGKS
jgi:hypothetical protein